MKTFSVAGKQYSLNLNIAAMDDIASSVGIDFLSLEQPGLFFIKADERSAMNVLMHLIEPQLAGYGDASEAGLQVFEQAKRAFKQALDENVYSQVKEALVSEVENFFQKLGPEKISLMRKIVDAQFAQLDSLAKGGIAGGEKSGEQPGT